MESICSCWPKGLQYATETTDVTESILNFFHAYGRIHPCIPTREPRGKNEDNLLKMLLTTANRFTIIILIFFLKSVINEKFDTGFT